jgi:SAM-dependent methyltransferase
MARLSPIGFPGRRLRACALSVSLPIFVVLLSACAAPAPATPRIPLAPPPLPTGGAGNATEARAPAADTSAGEEASVRPGANEQYLRSDDIDEWIRRFESGGREIFDRRMSVLQASGVAPGFVVADVGAGTGLFTRLFARAVGPSGRVYAVDIVPKFLAHIEAEAKRQGVRNIITVRGSDRSAALPPSSVDLIFLCDVYHHFEYPRSMSASMLQALRPGGTLMLIDFKRIPGKSPAWILEHVRAGQDVFTAEIEAAGFEKVGEDRLLEENYVVRFRKPAGTPSSPAPKPH